MTSKQESVRNRKRRSQLNRRLLLERMEDRRMLAAQPIGEEFLVNQVIDGGQKTTPGSPVAGLASNGDSVVVYNGKGPSDHSGVFGQRFDADGNTLGGPFRVNETRFGHQGRATVSVADNGDFVVAWNGLGRWDAYGVFARRFHADGTPATDEIQVNQTWFGLQRHPSVAFKPDGSFVVAWEGQGRGEWRGFGVFVRQFNADGSAASPETRVNTTTYGMQRGADVAVAPNGSFVVSWQGKGTGDINGVFMRRFDASGNPINNEIRVNSVTQRNQKKPSIAMDGVGNFAIVWQGREQGNRSGVFLQRFSADGTPIGTEQHINETIDDAQRNPVLSLADDGAFVVTWSSLQQDGDGWGVIAQPFDASGTKIGDELIVNTTTNGNQRHSSVAVQDNGDFLVVWKGRGTGDSNGIFARRYQQDDNGEDDTTPPTILAALANDTGTSSSDGLTYDPTITGTITDESSLVSFSLTIPELSAGPLELVGQVDPASGAFQLDRAEIESALGASLADGAYTLRFQATDQHGNASSFNDVRFTLDTINSTPVILSIDEDTGTADNDGITRDDSLLFTGTAEAGSRVTVREASLGVLGTVTTGANGIWTLDRTASPLPESAYNVTATAEDLAGNISEASLPFALVVDKTSPAAPVILAFQVDTGRDDSDGVTNDPTLIFSGVAEPNSSVAIRETGLGILGNAVADGSGDWTFNASGTTLTDGTYQFTSVATDLAGNASPISASVTVTLDSNSPDRPVVIRATDDTGIQGDRITADNTLVFVGTAEPNSDIALSEAGLGMLGLARTDTDGDWSVDTTATVLADGVYAVTATATDAAGNISNPSFIFEVTVDTQAPDAPILSDYAVDSGVSDTDGITNDNSLIFHGTAEPNSRITVRDTSLGVLGITFASATGEWTLDASATMLADGNYGFTATAEDLAGNLSSESTALDIVVDTVQPATPAISAIHDDTATDGDRITSDNRLIFSGTADPDSIVTVRDPVLGVVGTITTAGDGTWALDATGTTIADGTYDFTATATDLAGNASDTSSVFTVTVDTLVPNTPALTEIDQDTGSSTTDFVTNDNQLIFKGTAEAGSVVTLTETGRGILGSVTATAAGTWSVDATDLTLPNGSYELSVIAQDQAGNTSAPSSTVSLVVDTVSAAAPVIVSITEDSGSSASDRITSDNTLIFHGTAEPNSVVMLLESVFGNVGSATADGSGAWTIDTSVTSFADDNYVFSAIATDLAGNVSGDSPAFLVTVDTTAPAAPTQLDLTDASDTGISNTDNLTTDTTPTFSIDAESGSEVKLFANGILVGQETANNGMVEITVGELTNGVYAFTTSITDAAGNSSGLSSVLSIEIQAAQLPSPTFDLAASTDSVPTGDQATTFEIVTLVGQTEPNLTVEVLELNQRTTADASGVFTLLAIPLEFGGNRLTVQVSDPLGNTAQASQTITRLPTTDSVVLAEGNRFVTEHTQTIELGQIRGTRTVRFDIAADFDLAASDGALEDALLVYLVDPNDPTQTLLDRGANGTALFMLAGDQMELTPGIVRFDGTTVEIDVTSLGELTEGLLVFQLLGSDSDNGTNVEITNLTNRVDQLGVEIHEVLTDKYLAAPGPSVDLSPYTASSTVSANFSMVRFDSSTGRYTTELRLHNQGSAIGRNAVVTFADLPSGITLLNPSGTDGNGHPYVNMHDSIPGGGLLAGAMSDGIQIEFDNLSQLRFGAAPTVLVGPLNASPVLAPIDAITLSPGQMQEIYLDASDPDGDPLFIDIFANQEVMPTGVLNGNYLRFSPGPEDLGVYDFTVVVSDGVDRTEQTFQLTITEDPDPTTRISGYVLDTDGTPLPGVPISLSRIVTTTDANGRFEIRLPSTLLPTESFDLDVPVGDPYFDPFRTGTETIEFRRARYDVSTGSSVANPRRHPNLISSFIDASSVYGSDPARADALRSGTGGRLKVSSGPDGDLLPVNNATFFPNGMLENSLAGTSDPSTLFVAGDVRAAENPALSTLHTLFVREHNRLADEIAVANPSFTDEQIYQQARHKVGALLQHITYQEYLPVLLGAGAVPAYTGYDPNIDSSVGTFFTTAAFRIGHSQMISEIQRLDGSGNESAGGHLSLREAFFTSEPLQDEGVETLLRGLVTQTAEAADLQVRDELRNFLFGPPGSGGMDLPAMSVQRGREMGLPSYVQARRDYGLSEITDFADITTDVTIQTALQNLYGTVDKIDPFVGGLAEDPVSGSLVGPLFHAAIAEQFQATRDGDRFWYENQQFTAAELTEIRGTTLADLITRNTNLTGLTGNLFTTRIAPTGPAAGGSAAGTPATETRSFDGTGNNLSDSGMGAAGAHLRIDASLNYADGISEPNGADRPSARAVSNAVFAQPASAPDPNGFSAMGLFWGQFLAHDLALSPTGTSDTLKIHGDAANIPGSQYPFVAEKTGLLFGREIYENTANEIGRPIYLPAIDTANGVTVDPNVTTVVTTTAIPDADLTVAPGTLETRDGSLFTGQISITEVPRHLTPAALPADAMPDTVVTIQPAEMIFTTPAPLSFPNRAGYPEGTRFELMSINPETGQFDSVGISEVIGNKIVTVEGGVRNSSWHFPLVLNGHTQEPTQDLASNEDNKCAEDCKAIASGTSSIELHSGAYIEYHELVSYQSQGQNRSWQLTYDSNRVAPIKNVHFAYTDVETAPDVYIGATVVPEFSRAYWQSGNSLLASGLVPAQGLQAIPRQFDHFWSVPQGGDMELGAPVDLSSKPSGVYTLQLRTGVIREFENEFFGRSNFSQLTIDHVNTADSTFGAGWGLAGLEELVISPDESVLLIDGNGGELRFVSQRPDGNRNPAFGTFGFQSPAGDFSTLEYVPGNGPTPDRFVRTFPDQTVYTYRVTSNIAANSFHSRVPQNAKLETLVDRNDNTTRFDYDLANRLTTITDPVGLPTQFQYTGNRITSIVDPSGRTTELQYDDQGNLTRIGDPDGSQRQFEYNEQHKLTAETTKRGFREDTQYDPFGRVTSVLRKDGTRVEVEPVQTQAMFRYDRTASPAQAPDVRDVRNSRLAALASPFSTSSLDQDLRVGSHTDGTGRVFRTVLDQAGQQVARWDSEGAVGITERNADNLVTTLRDGRGNPSTLEYDDRGNLILFRDSESAGELAQQSLLPRPVFATGASPQATTLADFDGNGVLDIAIANGSDDSVSVWFNEAPNGFSNRVDYLVGSEPVDIVTGDINRDTYADMVVLNADSQGNNQSISILLGSDTGTFTAAPAIPIGDPVDSLDLGDLDGDGNLDLAITLPFSSQVTVRFGAGDGTFSAPTAVSTGTTPTDVSITNLYQTDVGHLVTLNQGSETVSVHTYQGGTFVLDQTLTTGLFPQKFDLADMDGDKDLDMVVIDSSFEGFGIFINDSGLFFPTLNGPLPLEISTDVTIGDLNGDGDPDILVSGSLDNQMAILIGGEGTSFHVSNTYSTGLNPASVSVGDINGDDHADVLAVHPDANLVSLMYGSGTGAFATRDDDLSIGDVGGMAVADLDADGDQDTVVVDPTSSEVQILRNPFYHSNRPLPVTIPVGQNPVTVQVADLNNDGFQDIVTANSGNGTVATVSILLGSATGFESRRDTPINGAPQAMRLADVDGDGQVDILVASDAQFDTAMTTSIEDTSGSLIYQVPHRLTGAPVTLPGTHGYSVVVDGPGSTSGPYRFRLIDTSLSPLLTSGESRSGNINAGRREPFRFNATVGDRILVDIDNADPTTVWQLYTPENHLIASGTGIDNVALLAPATGEYLLVLNNPTTQSHAYAFDLYADSVTTTPLTLDTPVTGTIDQPGQRHQFTLTATPGQQVSFSVGAGGSSSLSARLISPLSNSVLFNTDTATSSSTVTLVEGGEYRLVIEGATADQTGGYDFQLVDQGTDPGTTPVTATSLTLGTTVTGSLASVGDARYYTFNGTIGQQIYFDSVTSLTTLGPAVRLVTPSGLTTLFEHPVRDIDPSLVTLTEAGLYRLVVDGADRIGSYSFRLLDVSSQPITFGTPVTGTLPLRHAATYTFDGQIGQTLDLDSNIFSSRGSWSVYDPAGNLLAESDRLDGDASLPITLSGTHVLVLHGDTSRSQNYSLMITDPAGIPTTALTLGATVSDSIDQPGDRLLYTFTGTVGQRVYFDGISGSSLIDVRLDSPAGVSSLFSGDINDDFGPITLLHNGTYTLTVDGSGSTTGSFQFRLVDIATSPTSPVSTNTTVSATLLARTTDLFRFDAVAGQSLHLDTFLSGSSVQWTLYNPENQLVVSKPMSIDLDLDLETTGTYLLAIESRSLSNRSYAFNLQDLASLPATQINAGDLVSYSMNSLLDQKRFTFEGTAGDWVYLDKLSTLAGTVRLIAPDGTTLDEGFSVSTDSDPIALDQTGTYSLLASGSTGTHSFRLLTTTNDLAINVRQSGSLEARGAAIFRFQGVAGDSYSYEGFVSGGTTTSWALFGPDGTQESSYLDIGTDINMTLSQTGQHILVLRSNRTSPQSYQFRLGNEASLSGIPLTLDVETTGTITESGGRDRYTFAGSAGQVLYLDRYAMDPFTDVRLTGPNGAIYREILSGQETVHPIVLKQTGLFQLIIDPPGTGFGAYGFRLLDLSVATPARSGDTISGNLAAGQSVVVPVGASDGQRLVLSATGADNPSITKRLYSVDGQLLFGSSDVAQSQGILSETGTHGVVLENTSTTTQAYSLALHIGSVTRNPLTFAGTHSGSLTTAGDQYVFTFDGVQGQRLQYDALAGNSGNVTLQLRGPSHDRLLDGHAAGTDVGSITLLETGPYQLSVTGATPTDTGDFEFQWTDISDPGDPPVSSSVTVNPLSVGPLVNGLIGNIGDRHVYTLEGTAGDRLYLDGQLGFSLQGTLLSPSGSVVSHVSRLVNDGNPIELHETGSYSFVVEGGSGNFGSYRFRWMHLTAPVDTDDVSTLAINTTTTDTLASDETHVLKFDGTAGQQIDFFATSGCSSTCPNPPQWILYDPANQRILEQDLRFGAPLTLPTTGTYAVVLSSGTGHAYHFRPIDSSALTPGSITFGSSVSGSIDQVGQIDRYQFTGSSGQRLYFDGLTGSSSIVGQLKGPGGELILGSRIGNNADPVTLPASGTYTFQVESTGSTTGAYGFRFLDVGQDSGDVALLPFHTTVSGSITSEAVDVYRFSGNAGERIEVLSTSGCTGTLCPSPPTSTLYGPGNQAILTHDLRSGFEITLSQTGEYLLVLGGDDVSYDLRVVNPNAVPAVSIDIDTPIEGSINVAGGLDRYSFQGTAGQRFLVQGREGFDTRMSLVAPSGTVVRAGGFGRYDLEMVTLPETGDYFVEVDSERIETYRFEFRDLATSTTQAVSPNQHVSVAFDANPEIFTFNANVGDVLDFNTFDWTCIDGFCTQPYWRLIDPSDNTLLNQPISFQPTLELSQTGQYAIVITGGSGNIFNGTFETSFRLLEETVRSESALLDQAIGGQLGAGQSHRYDFTGVAGQRLLYEPLRQGRSVGVQILRGDGTGRFLNSDHVFTDSLATDLLATDLEGNGSIDLVTVHQGTNQIGVQVNDGSGTFTSETLIDVGVDPQAVAAGTLDSDSAVDLVVADALGSLHVLSGDGNGGFSAANTLNVGQDLRAVQVVDVDGDGNQDLVATNTSSPAPSNNLGTVAILRGDGQGNFDPPESFLVGEQPIDVQVVDLNGDGNLQVVTANEESGSISYREIKTTNDTDPGIAGTGERTFTYDPTFSQMTRSVDELGRVTLYTLDPANGDTLSIRRVFGQRDTTSGETDDVVTQFTYLPSGLTETMTDPLGRITRYAYDAQERLTGITYAVGTSDEAFETFEYDTAGNRTAHTDENGNRTEYQYDALNRLIQVTEPDPDGVGPETSPVTQRVYDVQGNLVTTTDALDNVTTHAYDALDRRIRTTDALDHVTRYAYDDSDNVVSIVDRLGRKTEFVYDTRNRLVETVDPLGFTEQLQYDPDDNLASVTDKNGNTTRYAYDSRDRLIREIDPIEGLMIYTYDPVDNLHRVTDELGRTTTYAYDALNRQTTKTTPDPDGPGGPLEAPLTQYVYDKANNLVETIDPLGNRTVSVYDQRDRVIQRQDSDPDGPAGPLTSPITTFTYDDGNRLTSVNDPLNRLTQYEYDGLDRLIRQSYPDPDGLGPDSTPIVTYTYDAMDNELSMTDPLGNVTQYQYDALYRTTQTIESDPDGAGPDGNPVTTYQYDAEDQLVAMIDPLGRTTSFQYDLLGRTVQETYPDPDAAGPLTSPIMTYTYDGVGNELSMTDALGNLTEYTYDALYRLTVLTEPDPDGLGPDANPITTYTYDAADQLTSVTDPLNRTIGYTYDALGRVTETTLPDPDQFGPLNAPVISYTYDAVDNQLAMTDALGNVTQYQYDNLYRSTRVIEEDPDGGGPESHPITQYTYDSASQLLSVSDPLNRTTRYQYDDLGRVTQVTQPDPDGPGPLASPTMGYVYDLVGNELSMTDPLGNVTQYAYDNLYRMIQRTDQDLDGAGPLGSPTTTYTYDLVDNLLSLTDTNGNTTAYTYDDLDRQVTETIDLGAEGLKSRSYVYDSMNNLLSGTDRNGRQIQYTYDNLYRNVTEQWFDDLGNLVHTLQFDYDIANQMQSADDVTAGSRYDYTYDDLGRVTQQQIDNGGAAVVLDTAYNAESLRTRLAASINGVGDFENKYQYDGLLRLATQTQQGQSGGASAAEKRFNYGYNAASQFTTLDRYNTLAGSSTDLVFTTSYEYDGMGRLSDLTHADQGNVYHGFAFTYDASSRITQINSSVDGLSDFNYDNVNQLTAAAHTSQSDESYDYDENGNRTGGGYQTGPYNRLASDGTYNYAYDAEGNRILRTEIVTGAVTEYTWDHRNRLIQITQRDSDRGPATKVVDQVYDAFNRWITRAVDADGEGPQGTETTRFVYDGNQIALQFDDTGSVEHRYTWGPAIDQILADESSDGWVLYPATNHLNTVTDLVDTTGAVTNHIQYDSFGNVISETNAAVDHLFGQTGRAFDEATGLSNHLNRWYDGDTGSWLSEDPIGFGGEDENLYRYVGNNPANGTDPDGLFVYQAFDFGNIQRGSKMVTMGLVGAAEGARNAAAKAVSTAVIGSTEIALMAALNARYGLYGDPGDKRLSDAISKHSELKKLVDFGGTLAKSLTDKNLAENVSRGIGKIAGDISSFLQRHEALLAAGCHAEASRLLGNGLGEMLLAIFAGDKGSKTLINKLSKTLKDPKVRESLIDFMKENRASVPLDKYTRDRIKNGDAPNSVAGVLDDSANFAQKSIRKSELFSPDGKFAGKTVNDVAELLRKGDLTPADIPLEYFTRGSGQTLILNTRSAEALRRAGIPRSQWRGIDISGDAEALRRLAGQLNRNKLWPNGTPTVRSSGGGQ